MKPASRSGIEALVQKPFIRKDGSRFWLCRFDHRNRIQIPKEIWEEQGWQCGDYLRFDVLNDGGRDLLIVLNLDAIARKEKA